ncbi:MAG: TSUP family transporter [Clostridiales bacterium]|nr:TSUP family transporter [Clostridiales bacterium]
MSDIIYIVVVLFATPLGALAGIGGGVIIKPVFDAFGEYSAAQISVVSSCAVFAMSLVSMVISSKQIKEQRQHIKTILPLAVGSAFGGWLGEFMFSSYTKSD